VHRQFVIFAEHEPKMWDNLKAQFINHLDQVNADLKAAGLPDLNSRAN
jgi:homogentisate 1,2-dioxygenase